MKLYADEPDHEPIRAFSHLVISSLARVEVPSAVYRKHRAGTVTAREAATLTQDFARDCLGTGRHAPRFAILAIIGQILDHAARLVAFHAIGASDAIQLASALAARGADPGCTTFACFDERLRDAAAAEGFALVP